MLVPGSPEEVWRAVATGPGISSWFVPSTIEERVGGAAICNFGPGMESVATIKQWNPPRSFVAESEEGPGIVRTEWIVEPRSGRSCIARVIHRWFASTDDWDKQFEGHAHGWRAFFRILRLYLTHFRGQPCSAFQLMGMAPEPKSEAWAAMVDALGFAGVWPGEWQEAAEGVPPLAGIVEWVGEVDHPELLIRLDKPTAGIAHLFPMEMGGQVLLSMRIYLYAEKAAAAVERDEPLWRAWIAERFPSGDSNVAGG